METKSVRKGKKGILIAITLILIFGGITAINGLKLMTQKYKEEIRDEKIPVQVTNSKFTDLDWILEQTGNIRPIVEVGVYPKVPGKIIESMLVETGDYLEKGTLIATLEDDSIKAQVEEGKAALESARANLKQVQANLEVVKKDRIRLKNLHKEKAVSRQKLDHIDAKYEATTSAEKLAQAQIKRAEAGLKLLEILYRDHKIKSPISGYVSARYADTGAMSNMMQPIIRISKEKEVKIVTTITEKDYPNVKKGMKVEIKVDAFPERVFTGTVSVISPTIDPATRSGEIEVRISNEDLTLSSGMFASVKLYLGEMTVLTVSRDALKRLPGTGNYYVYVVEEGRAVLKNVNTGLRQGNNVEIVNGLVAGEKVVIKGQNVLRDGTHVTFGDDGAMVKAQRRVEG